MKTSYNLNDILKGLSGRPKLSILNQTLIEHEILLEFIATFALQDDKNKSNLGKACQWKSLSIDIY